MKYGTLLKFLKKDRVEIEFEHDSSKLLVINKLVNEHYKLPLSTLDTALQKTYNDPKFIFKLLLDRDAKAFFNSNQTSNHGYVYLTPYEFLKTSLRINYDIIAPDSFKIILRFENNKKTRQSITVSENASIYSSPKIRTTFIFLKEPIYENKLFNLLKLKYSINDFSAILNSTSVHIDDTETFITYLEFLCRVCPGYANCEISI